MHKFTLIFTIAMLLCGAAARAQSIDLSLNVLYSNPNNANSGGTWQLVGKSGGSGIAGLEAFVTGIAPASVLNSAPRGTVNGDDYAGFFVQGVNDPLGFTRIIAAQAPLADDRAPSEEEAVFYGVGTIENGQPGAIGPTFTSLTDVQNSPWATGDVLLDPAWNTAAILASGTFAPGANPGFFSSGDFMNRGSIFTSLGSSTQVGAISTNPTVTAIVRRNLQIIFGGDYNENGIVDAADYTVWRDALGTNVPAGTGADGDGDGIINEGDYAVWKSNFGATIGSGAGIGATGSASAVPEPASCVLFAIAAIALGGWRRRSTCGSLVAV